MDVLPVPPARQFEYPRKKCKSDVHACNFNIGGWEGVGQRRPQIQIQLSQFSKVPVSKGPK